MLKECIELSSSSPGRIGRSTSSLSIRRKRCRGHFPTRFQKGKWGKGNNVFLCHISGTKAEEHKRFLCVEEMKNSSTVMREPAINGLRGFYVSIKVLSAPCL